MSDSPNPNDPSKTDLAQLFLSEWQKIRQLTYDYLAMLTPEHLSLRLPFPESQPLGYQFWCMVGAHESYLNQLRQGEWVEFACSLDGLDAVTPAVIQQQMEQADAAMVDVLAALDLGAKLKIGQFAYEVVMQMVKHEMHHHGQLINLMYCHHLPIPASWQQAWALKGDYL